VAGPEHVSSDHALRVLRAAGRSYPDLVELRSGRLAAAPDAVVTPGSPDEVQALLAACAEHDVAVVPFGGGHERRRRRGGAAAGATTRSSRWTCAGSTPSWAWTPARAWRRCRPG
jgi:FAD/FMN-containing dehydrogenase